MSQDWRQLFGAIDVSANGLRGTGAYPPPAAKPVTPPTAAVAPIAPQPVKVTIRPQSPPSTTVVASAVTPPAKTQAQTATPQPAATSYPGVWTMAQTFTASAAQFVASGGKTVSRELREERFSICKMCPQFDGTRCIQCGCFIAAKTWVPHEKCPAGKWPS